MTQALASALLHFIWEGALICCVYACLKVWFGSRGASFRFGLACAAMIALVALPAATFVICLPRESSAPVMSVAGRIASGTNTAAGLWFAPSAVDAIRAWRNISANWIVFAWLIGVLA